MDAAWLNTVQSIIPYPPENIQNKVMMDLGYRYEPSPNPAVRKKDAPRCNHSYYEAYLEPCVDCGRFCNCDMSSDNPDVIITTLDHQTVRLNSSIVRASQTLQRMVYYRKEKEKKALGLENLSLRKNNLDESEVILGDDLEEEGRSDSDEEMDEQCPEPDGQAKKVKCWKISTTTPSRVGRNGEVKTEEKDWNTRIGILDCDSDVMDLRKGDIPTVSITAKTLGMIQTYVSLHLGQVDEAVTKEYRARDFFAYHYLRKPKKKTLNHFRCEDWEKDFLNLDPSTLLDLERANGELFIWDLHFATEKWYHLVRGYPAADHFGQGVRVKENIDDEDIDMQDFLTINQQVYNPRRKSGHGRPQLYYTRALGHTFPRTIVKGSLRGNVCSNRKYGGYY